MIQSWSILIGLLVANVHGGTLKASGDCGSRIDLTKSKGDGRDPEVVAALTNECSVKWSADVSKLIECLQMAVAVNNLIKETADEATRLQLIVTEISAYKYVEVIQNGAIGGWGTIQQFIECKAVTGDCNARYGLTKPIENPFIVLEIKSACNKWSTDQTEVRLCTSMATRINNQISQGNAEAATLKGIVNQLTIYRETSERNANFIATTVIGAWGTLQRFIDCQGASATTTTTKAAPTTTTTKRTTTTPGKLDCSGMEKVLLKNAAGRIVILAAIEDGCYKYSSASACSQLLKDATEAITSEWPDKVREVAFRILWNYYGTAKNAIRRTLIPTWPSSSKPGTLLNFVDCGAPLIGGAAAGIAMNMSMPSSWTYPPQWYPAGQGQQTKEIAEANARTAFDKVKAAIERVDGSLVVEKISLNFPTGIQVLDYAKRNSVDYAGYIGGVVQIDSKGKIVGACTKGYNANGCTTAREFELGRYGHPRANLNIGGIMGPSIEERMMRAIALSLYEQGILLDENEIHYEEWE